MEPTTTEWEAFREQMEAWLDTLVEGGVEVRPIDPLVEEIVRESEGGWGE